MKKIIINVLLSIIMGIFCIQYAFAGPFGINMGMTLAEVRSVCKTNPKHLEGDVYEISPFKTNDMFKTYSVRIDPDYGVYWLKAIGKDIYTNDYGEDLKASFESLVKSISKTYGEESFRNDELKEGSHWGEPNYFMYALKNGDRKLYALWDKELDIRDIAFEKVLSGEILSTDLADTTFMTNYVLDIVSNYDKLPEDISSIYVGADAINTSKGYVVLEYSFSNKAGVKAKTDSVF